MNGAHPTAPLPTRPGFVAGVKCFFGGIGWLVTHPPVWPRAIVPMLVGVVMAGVLSISAVQWMPKLIGWLVGPTEGSLAGAGVGALKVLGTILAVIVSAFVALALAQPLSGPALEGIARMQERAVGAPERPPTSFLFDIVRSLQSVAVGAMFGVPAFIVLLLLSLLLPFASVVTVPLKLFVAAFTIAWDLCDYPMSIRGLPVRRRLETIMQYRGAVFGFSIGLALCNLLPCLLLLVLPAGVAGASRLMWMVEQHEAQQGRRRFTP